MAGASVRPPRYVLRTVGGARGWYCPPREVIISEDGKWRLTSLRGLSEYTETTPTDSYGVRPGPALTDVTGDLSSVLTLNGTYSRQRFKNFVRSSTGIFTDCEFVGRAPGGTFANELFEGTGSGAGAVVLDHCNIAPQKAAGTYYMNGVGGSNIDLKWCNIYNCCDSINGGSNIRVYDTWFHHMAFYMFDGTTLGGPGTSGGDHATDSRWPGATHNDHVQSMGGTGYVFERCVFDGFIAHEDAAHKNHPGYLVGACGNWQSLYNDTSKGFGFSNSGTARPEWNGAGQESGKWGSCFIVSPKTGIVTGRIYDCLLDGTEVLFQMPFQGGTYPDSGNNWNISKNRLGLPHGYSSFKRMEQMRMTSGMGTITIEEDNVYANVPTVTGLLGTPTTTPYPSPGNGVAGTFNGGSGTTTALSYTTRIA